MVLSSSLGRHQLLRSVGLKFEVFGVRPLQGAERFFSKRRRRW